MSIFCHGITFSLMTSVLRGPRQIVILRKGFMAEMHRKHFLTGSLDFPSSQLRSYSFNNQILSKFIKKKKLDQANICLDQHLFFQ